MLLISRRNSRGVMTEADNVMDGFKDPNKALDPALPSIRKKLFK